jgi:hypothetical protein
MPIRAPSPVSSDGRSANGIGSSCPLLTILVFPLRSRVKIWPSGAITKPDGPLRPSPTASEVGNSAGAPPCQRAAPTARASVGPPPSAAAARRGGKSLCAAFTFGMKASETKKLVRTRPQPGGKLERERLQREASDRVPRRSPRGRGRLLTQGPLTDGRLPEIPCSAMATEP